jgi:hypothetical protein
MTSKKVIERGEQTTKEKANKKARCERGRKKLKQFKVTRAKLSRDFRGGGKSHRPSLLLSNVSTSLQS